MRVRLALLRPHLERHCGVAASDLRHAHRVQISLDLRIVTDELEQPRFEHGAAGSVE